MTLAYITKFSAKRKTLGLCVERDKSIVVYAPTGTEEEVIDDFVNRKRLWLFEKLHYSPKFTETPPATPFVSGKAIPYLGRNYKLEILEEAFEGVRFNHKFHIARVNLADAPKLIESWYKVKAQEKIIPAAERYARQLGVSYDTISISDLKYSWGTCSPKNKLNFNWKLIKAPTFVLNYVVIHELAHLLELNHTDDFWNIVKVQMPNYLEAKEWLRENGERLFRE